MARKPNFLIVGVVLSVGLLACSSTSTKTVETISVTTTVVLACDPPEHLDCAGAVLNGINLSGEDLTGADLNHAFLSGAVLNYANLTGADLTLSLIHI